MMALTFLIFLRRGCALLGFELTGWYTVFSGLYATYPDVLVCFCPSGKVMAITTRTSANAAIKYGMTLMGDLMEFNQDLIEALALSFFFGGRFLIGRGAVEAPSATRRDLQ